MNKPEDDSIRLLWKSFLKGDDKSFSLLYQVHINPLLSYGYKLCPNHEIVHDCIQEVFIDLFLKRENLTADIRNLKAYLFVALRNCVIKKITKSRRHHMVEIKPDEEEFNFRVEYSFQDRLIEEEISDERKEILQSAIKELPAKQKEIIYLKFEEEMDYSEIATIQNITVESARKLLYRALLSLRTKIDSDIFHTFFLIFFK